MDSLFYRTRLASTFQDKPNQIVGISYLTDINHLQHIVKQVHNLGCQPQDIKGLTQKSL
jgi:hypothetical protein